MEYLDDRIDPDGSIEPCLDKNAGQWDVKIADNLYNLAKQCLEEKKKRPSTSEVLTVLQELNQTISWLSETTAL